MNPPQAKRTCRTLGCGATYETAVNYVVARDAGKRRVSRRYNYCERCRHLRHREPRRILCQTPEAARMTMQCCHVFEASLSNAEFAEIKIAKNRYCPKCRETAGGRLRALQLQTERGRTIYEIIQDAAKEAGASIRSRSMSQSNVIRRFHENLGVKRDTLHDWLRFFYGLRWPDWKRRYICREKSCSIVDVRNVKSRSQYSKYLPVIQLRQRGFCSCPIRGDDLILVDAPPEQLTPKALSDSRAPHTETHGSAARWSQDIKVRSGPHLPLLRRQADW